MFLVTLVVVFAASFESFTVPTVVLDGTHGMPIAGLGMCCRETAKGEAAQRAVQDYLLMGGRLIDTAVLYGNHEEIGRGIAQSGVPREDIFVTTKVWPNDFGFERTYESVMRSLKELGLDFVDLVLLHAPGIMHGSIDDPKNPPCVREQDGLPNWSLCRKSAWAALSNLKRSGHIRAIGVSNFGKRQIEELHADAQFRVQVNQIESHPWYPNQDTVEYCQAQGIIVTAYASLGSSKMAKQLLDNESLKYIGVPNGKTPSQVLLRWAVQRNMTVIPGTSNPEHMQENLVQEIGKIVHLMLRTCDSKHDACRIHALSTCSSASEPGHNGEPNRAKPSRAEHRWAEPSCVFELIFSFAYLVKLSKLYRRHNKIQA